MNRSMKTMDGNSAAAHVAYAYTDVAAIYPITPSSVMAELTDEWAAAGRNNLFGEPVRVIEMQSEGGVAGTVHGSLAAGALTTTFTASQGLLLMIPNMYKMAGELLPCVIHCSARALATHALSIFGDHSDIYACRQTGFAMLCTSSVQEVMDLAPIAHLAAIKRRIPFLHFFDGFRTSHEIQKIEVWSDEQLEALLDRSAVDTFRYRGLSPNRPVLRGSAQNPDIFFQEREVANQFYDTLPRVVEDYMNKINAMIGSNYHLFDYYGDPDAEEVIIAMGSVCETIEEVIDYKRARGEKAGLIKVRLYRPFSREHLLRALPDTVKSITVLDRTKEPGSIGEPLYLDVVAALRGSRFESIPVYTGRYGLGSKDVTPSQIFAVYRNGKTGEKPRFTVGITDDVTYLSLLETEAPNTTPEATVCCKFWGLGSDGTVGANKNSIKIIGDHTDLYAQGYFSYDSKKSGGLTVSHLRFGREPIKSTYLVTKADFVACHNPAYLGKYDMVHDIKPGGIFLLNCGWSMEELERRFTGDGKAYLAKNNIHLYTIDAGAIGKELGLGGRVNTVLQAAFFRLTGIIPAEDALQFMKDAATRAYGAKGDDIVAMNHAAIERGFTDAREVPIPAHWATQRGDFVSFYATGRDPELVEYVNRIQIPADLQKGDDLPVSTFLGREDGHLPLGTSQYEKRGIAREVPTWQPENCIQCNLCSLVCPHAVIRPVAMTEAEAEKAPAGMPSLPMTGLSDHRFAITTSVMDCTGCTLCVGICPGKKGQKALAMARLEGEKPRQVYFDYGRELTPKPAVMQKFGADTVKGSQFRQPLLEFSGACAGCGETPYAKLLTQLFGPRMYIANATGCSSIWGGSAPGIPYTKNEKGQGPAWANSLFEDNAEYGYGMYLAQDTMRKRLIREAEALVGDIEAPHEKEVLENYLATLEDGEANLAATDTLIDVLSKSLDPRAQQLLHHKQFLSKKSNWILGGDGWAYDIGFGGLDHVMASGADVNVLVFDTEVYSNTGGQMSKSTPTGAVAQFAANGKEGTKKDLAYMMMTYGSVYVAQVALGADFNQTLKAFREAESFPGPSLIIAYSPCINHGIRGGMVNADIEMKKAVECGYWNLFRYDPRRKAEGKNPFQMDSKAPTGDYQAFLKNEVRYSALMRTYPERASRLFDRAEVNAIGRHERLLQWEALSGKLVAAEAEEVEREAASRRAEAEKQ